MRRAFVRAFSVMPRAQVMVAVLLVLVVVGPLVPVAAAWASPAAVAAEGHGAEGTPSPAEAAAHSTDPHASEGHGSGDHAPAIDTKKLALQFLNFGVLVFLLVKFGGGAINKALAARHHQLKADLTAAAAARAAAEAKLTKQEARLTSLEQEIAEMRRGIKAEAESEKARLIATAEERAKRITAETAFLVEQQVRDAEVRLRRESAEAAIKVAEEILRRSVGAADQKRMLDTFVTDIEQTTPAQPERGA